MHSLFCSLLPHGNVGLSNMGRSLMCGMYRKNFFCPTCIIVSQTMHLRLRRLMLLILLWHCCFIQVDVKKTLATWQHARTIACVNMYMVPILATCAMRGVLFHSTV